MRAASLFIAFVLLSCSTKPSPPSQTMRMNIATDPVTLDPRKARALNAVTVSRMLFEGLTRIGKEGLPELALAESVDVSDDGLTYTFRLRPSFWSDGQKVTSYDFVNSYQAILDPQFPADIAYQLYVIRNAKQVKQGFLLPKELGVETPDAATLIVHLEQPTPYFCEVCTMASFLPVPSHVALHNPDWAQDPKTFVGNGPFVLDAWRHNDELLVQKNETYWDAENVHLQKISLLMVSGETELQMFEENLLDWAGSPLSVISLDVIAHLEKTEQLQRSSLSGTHLLRVNTSPCIDGKPNPLALPELRKALAYAIDRSAITKGLLHGRQAPARSLVPPAMGLSEKGYFSDQNPDVARCLFSDALQQARDIPPIVLQFINAEHNMSLAQVIQEQLRKVLGIEVGLEAMEAKVFHQKIKQLDYQLAIGSWVADFNDPINFLEVFKYKRDSSNNTGWEEPRYVALLDKSLLCRDPEERKRLFQEAEGILMDQMPIIPLYHYAMNFLQQEAIADVVLSPIGQIDVRFAQKVNR